jgi:hypothetical protein
MCNNNSVSREAWTICSKCGEYIDSVGRCGCDYKRMPVMGGHRNSQSRKHGIVAAVAGIALAASLFLSPAAKAQDAQPQPTPSVGEPPKALHVVYLPLISFPAEVHGCDDCQAVSWRPTGS